MQSYIVVVFLCFAATAPPTTAKQPNIVFILADDLGYNDVGYSKYADSKTPFLDKLVSESLDLKYSYTHSICTPSRSALFTGMYPWRYGLQRAAIEATHPDGLDTSYKLLPEYMRNLGYQTHLVGKWHLGLCKKAYLPTHRGFDSFRGIYGGHTNYSSHIDDEANLFDYWQNEHLILDKDNVYCTDDYAEYAEKLIAENGGEKPMFLFLSQQAVHAPLQAPPGVKPESNEYRDIMKTVIRSVDNFTETIVKALEKANMWDNTVLIFSSDNGGSPPLGGNNYPLRGGKHTLYEGGTRIRSFIRGPGIAKGHYTGLVHVIDWLPTIVSMAGGKVHNKKVDGVDQFSAFKTNPDKLQHQPRTEFFYNVDVKRGHKNQLIDASAVRFREKDGDSYRDFKFILGDPGTMSKRFRTSYRPTEEGSEDHPYFPDGILFDLKVKDIETEETPLTESHYDAMKEKLKQKIIDEKNGRWVDQVKTGADPDAMKQEKHGRKYLGPGWC